MTDMVYKLLLAIEKRHNISYMQEGETVPILKLDANIFVLKGEFAIMDLLLQPKLHIISGHACFRIDDIVSLHMALGRSIEFTVIPYSEPELCKRELRIRDEIHGC